MPGKYFDELEVGMKFKHALGRTVTEMDNVLFSALTMNTQPLHVNQDFPPLCEGAALTFNGPGIVPASGGSYTATLTWTPPPPPMPAALCSWSASSQGPITISPIGGGGTPPATINVTVAANPSTTPRAAFIKVTFLNLPFPSEATLTINQAAGP